MNRSLDPERPRTVRDMSREKAWAAPLAETWYGKPKGDPTMHLFIIETGSSRYRFLTSVAQPSMPSPLLPTATSSLTVSIPFVPFINSWLLMPPALARPSGSNSNIGVKNPLIFRASSTEKWYFSRRTSGNAQCRNRWMLRSSPLRLKISCDHFPDKHNALGNEPSSSTIWAM